MTDLQHLFNVDNESGIIPVIPYEEEDELIHTVEHPSCNDPKCPCGGGGPSSLDEDEENEEGEQ